MNRTVNLFATTCGAASVLSGLTEGAVVDAGQHAGSTTGGAYLQTQALPLDQLLEHAAAVCVSEGLSPQVPSGTTLRAADGLLRFARGGGASSSSDDEHEGGENDSDSSEGDDVGFDSRGHSSRRRQTNGGRHLRGDGGHDDQEEDDRTHRHLERMAAAKARRELELQELRRGHTGLAWSSYLRDEELGTSRARARDAGLRCDLDALRGPPPVEAHGTTAPTAAATFGRSSAGDEADDTLIQSLARGGRRSFQLLRIIKAAFSEPSPCRRFVGMPVEDFVRYIAPVVVRQVPVTGAASPSPGRNAAAAASRAVAAAVGSPESLHGAADNPSFGGTVTFSSGALASEIRQLAKEVQHHQNEETTRAIALGGALDPAATGYISWTAFTTVFASRGKSRDPLPETFTLKDAMGGHHHGMITTVLFAKARHCPLVVPSSLDGTFYTGGTDGVVAEWRASGAEVTFKRKIHTMATHAEHSSSGTHRGSSTASRGSAMGQINTLTMLPGARLFAAHAFGHGYVYDASHGMRPLISVLRTSTHRDAVGGSSGPVSGVGGGASYGSLRHHTDTVPSVVLGHIAGDITASCTSTSHYLGTVEPLILGSSCGQVAIFNLRRSATGAIASAAAASNHAAAVAGGGLARSALAVLPPVQMFTNFLSDSDEDEALRNQWDEGRFRASSLQSYRMGVAYRSARIHQLIDVALDHSLIAVGNNSHGVHFMEVIDYDKMMPKLRLTRPNENSRGVIGGGPNPTRVPQFTRIDIDPAANLIIASGHTRVAALYTTAFPDPITELADHHEPIVYAALNLANQQIHVLTADKCLHVYDARMNRKIQVVQDTTTRAPRDTFSSATTDPVTLSTVACANKPITFTASAESVQARVIANAAGNLVTATRNALRLASPANIANELNAVTATRKGAGTCVTCEGNAIVVWPQLRSNAEAAVITDAARLNSPRSPPPNATAELLGRSFGLPSGLVMAQSSNNISAFFSAAEAEVDFVPPRKLQPSRIHAAPGGARCTCIALDESGRRVAVVLNATTVMIMVVATGAQQFTCQLMTAQPSTQTVAAAGSGRGTARSGGGHDSAGAASPITSQLPRRSSVNSATHDRGAPEEITCLRLTARPATRDDTLPQTWLLIGGARGTLLVVDLTNLSSASEAATEAPSDGEHLSRDTMAAPAVAVPGLNSDGVRVAFHRKVTRGGDGLRCFADDLVGPYFFLGTARGKVIAYQSEHFYARSVEDCGAMPQFAAAFARQAYNNKAQPSPADAASAFGQSSSQNARRGPTVSAASSSQPSPPRRRTTAAPAAPSDSTAQDAAAEHEAELEAKRVLNRFVAATDEQGVQDLQSAAFREMDAATEAIRVLGNTGYVAVLFGIGIVAVYRVSVGGIEITLDALFPVSDVSASSMDYDHRSGILYVGDFAGRVAAIELWSQRPAVESFEIPQPEEDERGVDFAAAHGISIDKKTNNASSNSGLPAALHVGDLAVRRMTTVTGAPHMITVVDPRILSMTQVSTVAYVSDLHVVHDVDPQYLKRPMVSSMRSRPRSQHKSSPRRIDTADKSPGPNTLRVAFDDFAEDEEDDDDEAMHGDAVVVSLSETYSALVVPASAFADPMLPQGSVMCATAGLGTSWRGLQTAEYRAREQQKSKEYRELLREQLDARRQRLEAAEAAATAAVASASMSGRGAISFLKLQEAALNGNDDGGDGSPGSPGSKSALARAVAAASVVAGSPTSAAAGAPGLVGGSLEVFRAAAKVAGVGRGAKPRNQNVFFIRRLPTKNHPLEASDAEDEDTEECFPKVGVVDASDDAASEVGLPEKKISTSKSWVRRPRDGAASAVELVLGVTHGSSSSRKAHGAGGAAGDGALLSPAFGWDMAAAASSATSTYASPSMADLSPTVPSFAYSMSLPVDIVGSPASKYRPAPAIASRTARSALLKANAALARAGLGSAGTRKGAEGPVRAGRLQARGLHVPPARLVSESLETGAMRPLSARSTADPAGSAGGAVVVVAEGTDAAVTAETTAVGMVPRPSVVHVGGGAVASRPASASASASKPTEKTTVAGVPVTLPKAIAARVGDGVRIPTAPSARGRRLAAGGSTVSQTTLSADAMNRVVEADGNEEELARVLKRVVLSSADVQREIVASFAEARREAERDTVGATRTDARSQALLGHRERVDGWAENGSSAQVPRPPLTARPTGAGSNECLTRPATARSAATSPPRVALLASSSSAPETASSATATHGELSPRRRAALLASTHLISTPQTRMSRFIQYSAPPNPAADTTASSVFTAQPPVAHLARPRPVSPVFLRDAKADVAKRRMYARNAEAVEAAVANSQRIAGTALAHQRSMRRERLSHSGGGSATVFTFRSVLIEPVDPQVLADAAAFSRGRGRGAGASSHHQRRG
jgi:hypothetical protein